MTERPEDLMAGLDLPRQIPGDLRRRLEAGLLGDEARSVRPELAEALADALTGDEDLLAGIDGPRVLAPSTRLALERGLSGGHRRWVTRAPWLAGAAAACLVAALIGASTLGHDSRVRQTTAPVARTLPAVPSTSGAGPTANAQDEPASGAATPNGPSSASGSATATPSAAPLAPAVDRVAPSSGPTAGGNLVVIMGSDLSGATSVEFGGTGSTHFTIRSSNEIDAVAPAHAAGPVPIVVKLGTRPSAVEPGDRYTYVY